ncbi:MAG: glycosyltransferase, partial [Acetobacteraceae bacterium]|nr:glycosyltransferase [Acetobacteraceae bacterium]
MKLAHVMAGSRSGGAELFFERLVSALAREGDSVLPVIRRNADRAARLAAAGVPSTELAFGGLMDLFTRPRLRSNLLRHAPRAVVAWMSRAARHTPQGDWVLLGRLGGYYDLRYYRHCDHLVANTRGLVAWIKAQGWPAQRVHYLPNFVHDAGGAPPAELGVPPGAKKVLALGRLHPNKGFDILVRAMAHLPAVHAVIAGEGPERTRL